MCCASDMGCFAALPVAMHSLPGVAPRVTSGSSIGFAFRLPGGSSRWSATRASHLISICECRLPSHTEEFLVYTTPYATCIYTCLPVSPDGRPRASEQRKLKRAGHGSDQRSTRARSGHRLEFRDGILTPVGDGCVRLLLVPGSADRRIQGGRFAAEFPIRRNARRIGNRREGAK